MKSLSRTSTIKKRAILISIVIVLLIILSGFLYWNLSSSNKPLSDNKQEQTESKTQNNAPPTDEEKNTGASQKQAVVEQDQNKPDASRSSIEVTITAANQNGTTINIRSLINAVTGTGDCKLVLSNNTSVITKTSGIQPLAGSSTCKGFNIATAELSKGTWHAVLTITTGNSQGKAEKDFTVN